jgi:hypothetical protein
MKHSVNKRKASSMLSMHVSLTLCNGYVAGHSQRLMLCSAAMPDQLAGRGPSRKLFVRDLQPATAARHRKGRFDGSQQQKM